MCGNLGKSCLGGSKKGLIYVLLRDHGAQVAAKVMSRLAKLCARWLGNRGFSIGIDDVTPPPRLIALKKQLLEEGSAVCRYFAYYSLSFSSLISYSVTVDIDLFQI
jgi:DNA-directed RNA polymerase III subunit RPC1